MAADCPFATAIERIHVSDQGSWGLSQFNPADNHQQPLGQVVENAGLQPILHQALTQAPRIDLIPGAQVTALRPISGGMQLSWQSPQGEQRQHNQLVILADGADSPAPGAGHRRARSALRPNRSGGQCAF